MSYLKTHIVRVTSGILLLSISALPAIAGQESTSNLRQGLPGRRISGGTRSECMAGSAPIVALNPETNLSETISAEPSVHFIVPATENAYPLEFSLRDSDGNRVYEKSLDTHEHNGIVGIQLPLQSLEINQDYRWYLSVMCDAQDSSQSDVLSGWLRQVNPDVAVHSTLDDEARQSVEARLELASEYQTYELWADAISTVASLREQYPHNENVRQSWHQLLQALELESAASESIAMR